MYKLIEDLDPNHEGKIICEEFVLMLKYIEQKVPSNVVTTTMGNETEMSKSNLP